MSPPEDDVAAGLPLRHAALLGLLHGPAELLPVSSSGHVTLVPWLAGWPYGTLDPEVRKAFEVALHAGTAAALVLVLREDIAALARRASPRVAALLLLSTAVPAAVGLALERPIEQRMGTPRGIAAGLLAGSAAMLLADLRGGTARRRADAGAVDGVVLGLAQACALVPGSSRNGLTLAAARARGYGRADASALSWDVALPVIGGATVLKGARLARRGLPRGLAAPFAAGAVAAFGSTLLAARLLANARRAPALAPYVAYRAALAVLVLARR